MLWQKKSHRCGLECIFDFDRLLCNTSSFTTRIIPIMLSKKLEEIFIGSTILPLSRQSWDWTNRRIKVSTFVPIYKVLISRSNFDTTPLLQWQLKLLHPTMGWLEGRKLSAMYQFVSVASHVVVEDMPTAKNEQLLIHIFKGKEDRSMWSGIVRLRRKQNLGDSGGEYVLFLCENA